MKTNSKKHDSKNPTVAKLSKSILTKILWIMAKIIGVVAGILVTLFLIVGLYSEYAMEYEPYHGKKFDREVWMSVAEPGCSKLVRCKMTADIVNNHLHKGMTKEEVEGLLGEIDHYYYCLDRKVKCTGYYMGSCSVSALGSLGGQNIFVCFDENERMVAAGRDAIPCNEMNTAACSLEQTKSKCRCTEKTPHIYRLYDCEVEKW